MNDTKFSYWRILKKYANFIWFTILNTSVESLFLSVSRTYVINGGEKVTE